MRARSHRLPLVAVVLILVLGLPTAAQAKVDWIGWLEGFSGPGPSEGFELSLEFGCLNIAQRSVVKRSDIERVLPKLQTVAQAFAELQRVAPLAAGAEIQTLGEALARMNVPVQMRKTDDDIQSALDVRSATESPVLSGRKLDAALAATEEKLSGDGRTALDELKAAIKNAPILETAGGTAALLGFGRFEGQGRTVVVPSRTTRTLSVFGAGKGGATIRSCRGARREVEVQRAKDRTANAALLVSLTPQNPDSRSADDDFTLSRQDWQTGLVLGVGRYKSLENVLFDKSGTLSGDSEEPQLRFIPIELLAHSKLGPAVDIGAGVGVAWFVTQARDGSRVGSDRLAFYYVPLSAVIRPAAMFFPRSRLASAVGYRVAVRRFRELDGTHFGTDADAFREPGEFIWGHALYFDLVTLFGK